MNIFSYESKFSQILMFVADLAILNLVFVLCCIPIFTIGAAQAALYSGIRTLQDPEDDSSPVKAFFRAFKVGFGSVTGAWFVFSVLEFLMASIIYGMLLVPGFPVWTAILAFAVLILFHSPVALFHARFSCTAGQLIRNSFMLVIAYPIRAFLMAALTWLPFILFLWDMSVFAAAIPAWALLYFGVAALLSFNIMKKPFKVLIDHYNETHDEDGNMILATVNEEGELVYENSIQDALDAQAELEKEEEEEEYEA